MEQLYSEERDHFILYKLISIGGLRSNKQRQKNMPNNTKFGSAHSFNLAIKLGRAATIRIPNRYQQDLPKSNPESFYLPNSHPWKPTIVYLAVGHVGHSLHRGLVGLSVGHGPSPLPILFGRGLQVLLHQVPIPVLLRIMWPHQGRMNTLSQMKSNTKQHSMYGIYDDQLIPLAPPQLIGIYTSLTECMTPGVEPWGIRTCVLLQKVLLDEVAGGSGPPIRIETYTPCTPRAHSEATSSKGSSTSQPTPTTF